MTNEEVDAEFDAIYKSDPAFEEMLSGYVDNFSAEEKYTIVVAYKQGGGIEGLKDIIDLEEEDEEQQP